MLFGHGDDHYNSQKEVKINFSSNVWHGADLRTLREHLNEQFYELTRYPEPDASSLKRLLARCYEVEEENIVCLCPAFRWKDRISAGSVTRIIRTAD